MWIFYIVLSILKAFSPAGFWGHHPLKQRSLVFIATALSGFFSASIYDTNQTWETSFGMNIRVLSLSLRVLVSPSFVVSLSKIRLTTLLFRSLCSRDHLQIPSGLAVGVLFGANFSGILLGGHYKTKADCSELTIHAHLPVKHSHLTALSIRAPHRSAFFVTVIVETPVIQAISIVLAVFIIALEYPVPLLKGTRLHRSIVARIPLLLLQAFFAVLFYQASPCYFVPAHDVS